MYATAMADSYASVTSRCGSSQFATSAWAVGTTPNPPMARNNRARSGRYLPAALDGDISMRTVHAPRIEIPVRYTACQAGEHRKMVRWREWQQRRWQAVLERRQNVAPLRKTKNGQLVPAVSPPMSDFADVSRFVRETTQDGDVLCFFDPSLAPSINLFSHLLPLECI
ncbi:tfp pilus assembly protein [Striga asiatica]|uniref:Tfp pilus assembly protein n=1 Tax=Striga asiatica TaxID=4170 RepID=A0A5A7RB19_STRAF|nr:tfp pilus assembly protein [Striga asiatica]